MRLSNGEIIYTDPLNADTDSDVLKDGEEITPQFKFADSSGIGLPGFPCGIYFKMNSDPNMEDSDGDSYNDLQDLAPMIKYKNPVILIHGREDNSKNCFGIGNHITKEDNNGYGYENTSDFSDVYKQELLNTTGENSIARKLVDNGYVANENLFAFNYPNQDVTYINAIILQNYIYNLSNNKTSSLFFATKNDKENKNVKFNIIAHSNGGLVSRYYIENLGGDSYIRKLITIDTPHYGADLSQYGSTSILSNWSNKITPMDYDLANDSRLFTGNIKMNFSNLLFYNFNDKVQYAMNHQSPKLNGHNNISTVYYAIGGVAYGYNVTNGTKAVEFEPSYTDIIQFISNIIQVAKSEYNIDIPNLSMTSGDNVINICTQFGIKLQPQGVDNYLIISEHIPFKGFTLIINDEEKYRQYIFNGNYSLGSITSNIFFHNDIKTKLPTQQSVLKYLKEVF